MSQRGTRSLRRGMSVKKNNILASENFFLLVKSTTYSIGKHKSLKSLKKKIVDKPKNICYTWNITIEKEEI